MAYREDTAEIVIVGAGPAGSTLAALLAGRGHDVLLLDRAIFPRDKTCGDGLTPRAVGALARLGLLDGLAANGYRRIHAALLHAPNGDRWLMRFADYDLGLPTFGLVVPRFELDDYLRRHAVSQGARFRGGVDAERPLYGAPTGAGRRTVIGVEARTADGPLRVHARITVLATGAAIGLLRAFGVLRAMPPGINAVRGYFARVPDLTDAFEFYFDADLAPGYGWVFPVGEDRANIGLGVLARDGTGPAINLRSRLDEFLRRHRRLAAAVPAGSEGVRFYPHLAGATSPHWANAARGAFHGLSLATTRGHLTRAVLEGVAYQIRENLEITGEIAGPAAEVILYGGGAQSALWREIIGDVLGRPIAWTAAVETAGLGAAMLAAAGCGACASLDEARDQMAPSLERRLPRPDRVALYAEQFAAYRRDEALLLRDAT